MMKRVELKILRWLLIMCMMDCRSRFQIDSCNRSENPFDADLSNEWMRNDFSVDKNYHNYFDHLILFLKRIMIMKRWWIFLWWIWYWYKYL